MAEGSGEKTEKATPKRKKDERKKGNVFLSHELITVASLVASFYTVQLTAPNINSSIQRMIRHFFSLSSTMDSISKDELSHLLLQGFTAFLSACLPVMLVCIFVAIALTLAQTKLLFSAKALKPKANRLSPISGFKKIISIRGLVELVKSILKISVLVYIIFSVLQDRVETLPRLMDVHPLKAISVTGDMILSIIQQVAAVFVILAVFDYIYQWWQYEKNLRMSKQEIKEEYKQTEGDPQIKGKIKDRQQAMSRRRMMQNVPDADVVLRNPTHYAVAIKYDPEKNSAPVVTAKGADSLALKIVEVAEENDVVVLENRPLARGLYESVELEREIPEKFYQAVAEVLAFVYSLKKKDLK